jgi:glucokinase
LAGLAEAHFGAGQGKSRVAYMNIGSGIGGALVIDGRLYASQGEGASEIGHLRIRPGHPGAPWQTLEDLASGWSLARAARRVAEADDTSNIYRRVEGLTSKITAQTLIQAVEERDPPAVDIWLKAIEHWSVAIANVITLFRPEVFVIGGGVALAGDILFEPLKREVARQVFAPFLDSYDILPAALGEEVVVHGALKLASDVV